MAKPPVIGYPPAQFPIPGTLVAADSLPGGQLQDAVAGAGLAKDGSENLSVVTDAISTEIQSDAVVVKGGPRVHVRSTQTGMPALGTVIATLTATAGYQLTDIAFSGSISTAGTGNPDLGVTFTFSDATTLDLNPAAGGAGAIDLIGAAFWAMLSRTGGPVVFAHPASAAGNAKKVTKVEIKVTDADTGNSRTYIGSISARERRL